jgi:hypothetical protein
VENPDSAVYLPDCSPAIYATILAGFRAFAALQFSPKPKYYHG